MEPARPSRDELLADIEALRRRLEQDQAAGARTVRIEEGAREFGERYREIVENLTNVFYAHTAEHVLTYLSPQMEDLIGMTPEDALVRWTELVTDHPINERGFTLTQRAIDTGERQEPYELQLRRADGGTVWVEVREAPVVREGRTVAIVGALTDVTLRKRMEGLLRLELNLGLTLSGSHDAPSVLEHALDAVMRVDEVDAAGLYVRDDTTGDMDLVCHRGISETFVEAVAHIDSGDIRAMRLETERGHFPILNDVSREEGLSAVVVVPVWSEDEFLACLNVASRHVETFAPPALDGLETIGSLVGHTLSRIRAEVSLARSEAKLRGMVHAAPVGIGISSNRVIRWVNEHMVQMTGYDHEELVGHAVRFLYESDAEYERVSSACAAFEQGGTATVETSWRTKNGRILDIILSASALDPEDHERGVVFTAWDDTERRRAAEQRRRFDAKVQHAQKLESLGILAGGIAHDFNNILHAILGHADLAAHQLGAEERARGHIERVGECVDQASALCNQLLAYSGRGSFVRRILHLGETVQDIADMLDVSISKKAALSIEVADNEPLVEADAAQIRQVVMNLITNASEALGTGSGKIIVSISGRFYDGERLGAEFPGADMPPGLYARLEVSDTGCGMDDETQSRIFEPFYTTKFTGRGLGMAAVQGIVRGHGGGIRIRSAIGAGTTVTVILPAAPEPARGEPAAPEPPATAREGGTILLVDDDAVLRSIGTAMLEEAGFQVITARNGKDALEIYRDHHAEILCVLLDLTMPEMDGDEALVALRAIRPDAPIVVCSGYSEQEIRTRFAAEVPSAFLQKPFASARLLRTLDEVLGNRTGE